MKDADSTTKSKPPSRLWRLFRAFATTLLVLLALVAGLVLAVVKPPNTLLRLAALPMLRKALNHPNLKLNKLNLRPLHFVEFEGLELGAPHGFQRPLLSVRRITLKYDLRELLAKKVTVQRFEVDHPEVHLEKRGKRSNWQVFISRMPQSDEKKEAPASEAGEFPIDLYLRDLRINGTKFSFREADQQFSINDLSLFASGNLGTDRGKLKLGLRLGETLQPDATQDGNLSLSIPIGGGETIAALFAFKTRLDLNIDKFAPPTARVSLACRLDSRNINSAFALPPIRIALKSEANANLTKEEANIQSLFLSLNDTPIVDLNSTLKELGAKNRMQVELRQLNIPLTMLATYLKPFLPQLSFGGNIRLRDVQATAPLDSKSIDDLGDLSGKLAIDSVWGIMKTKRGRVKLSTDKVNARLRFKSLAATEVSEQSISLEGKTDIGDLQVAGARVKNIALETKSQVALKLGKPHTFAGKLKLRLPSIQYNHPSTGAINTHVRLKLEATGNLEQQTIDLQRLNLNIQDLLRAKISGKAKLSKRRPFDATLAIAPVHLPTLIKALPRKLRRQLKPLGLRGKVALRLKANGYPPTGRVSSPLDLPLRYQATVKLRDVGVKQAQAHVQGLSGQLKLTKKAGTSLVLKSLLTARRITSKPAKVEVGRVELPIKVEVKKQSLSVKLGLMTKSISTAQFKSKEGASLNFIGTYRLPVHRLIAGKPLQVSAADLKLSLGMKKGVLEIANEKVLANNLAIDAHIEHRPKSKKPTRIKSTIAIGSVGNPRRKAVVKRLALALTAHLPNAQLSLPNPELPEHGGLKMQLSTDAIRYPGVLKEPLKKSSLAFGAQLNEHGRFRLEAFRLNIPTQGLRLNASGSIERATSLLSQKLGPLPPLGFAVNLALEKPMARQLKQAHYLAPGLKMGGMLGLKMSVVGKGERLLDVKGRIEADEFSIWKRIVQLQKKADGNLSRLIAVVALKGINADIPIAQKVDLRFGSGKLEYAVAKASRSIFQSHQSSTALYRTMRPYLARQRSFSVAEARLKQNVAEMNRAGHLLAATDQDFKAGPLSLDLAIDDSSVFLNRLYLGLFKGDVSGAVKAQPLLGGKFFDMRAQLRTQLTGVNLAYLDSQAKRHGRDTELSALVDLKYQICRPDLTHGRVEITQISLEHLDALLAYLDPNNLDKKIQLYRQLLKGLIAKILKPRIKRVSINIRHANLNMDVRIETRAIAAPLGAYVNGLLKQNPIRRYNLLPILPKLCGEN